MTDFYENCQNLQESEDKNGKCSELENGKQNGAEALSLEIVSMVKWIKRTEQYKINQAES